jgi:hypothetical protein
MTEAIELPRVLLLDEADASLHPSMVKCLLTVIEEIFVKQYGVTVLLTTHSPSTVALTPTDSLYVMSRELPRLRPASVDEALRYLTVGLPALSVRLENRRQIFVESEHDQAVFQDVFSVLRPTMAVDRTAEFIAAGRREVGGGCDAVKRLVREIRAAGVDTVHGIVDRDERGGAPDHVHYLPDRHSVENLLLEPLLLGTFLLRERILTAAELGVAGELRHFELRNPQAHPIAAALGARLGFGTDTRDCEYLGGFTASVATEFLDMRGHDLEARVVDAFPGLRAYKQGLKRAIVTRALVDVPHFAPLAVVDLFREILA